MGSFSEADLRAKGLTEVEPGKWRKVTEVGSVVTVQNIKDAEKTFNQMRSNFDQGQEGSVFIPYNVATSKNKKRLFVKKVGIKTIPGIAESIPATKYRKLTKSSWIAYRGLFLRMLEGKEKPYHIQFIFARATKSEHWDFHNMVQLPCDLMQEHGWIEDDNIANMIPVYGKHFQDKQNPGLYIKVL